jgi:hypothetical protein
MLPAARAGAPAANSTFFCDAEGVSCFSRSTAMLNYTSAATACALRQGKLLHPTTGTKQLAVESYFRVGGRDLAGSWQSCLALGFASAQSVGCPELYQLWSLVSAGALPCRA